MKSKLVNKAANAILVIALTLSGFWAGIYYGIVEFENQVQIWDTNYQIITDKVWAYEKVADPKTIRSYVKELNKILDDINFLNNLVKSGQLADESLVVYASMVEDVDDRLIMLRKEMYDELESLRSSITVKTDDKVYGLKKEVVTDREAVLSKLGDINRRLDALEDMTSEISADVNTIKSSKYAKKIWVKDKD
jgi:hypothetical protein